MVADIIKVFIL